MSTAFFLQLLVVLAACRLCGWVARRWLGQPQVVGEMVAGILLGPSGLGLLAPAVQAALFPPETRPLLSVLAQLGVGFYMFLVGLGFRRDHFAANARSALAVSVSGMAAPFAAAALLAPWLLRQDLFGPAVTQAQATLFLGACISITAFPILARILAERGLSRTPLGSLSLSAGAMDDAGAWTVLALVLSSFGDGPGLAVRAIGGGALFAAFALLLAPRLLAPLGARAERDGTVHPPLLAAVLMLFAASAWAMDAAGLHAVFGGFLLGVAMPRGVLADELHRQLEPVTTVALVPLFFTFSGLHTELALVTTPATLLAALAVLAASVLAKGGACWAAARFTGQDNPTALAVGVLMNARGLMELIIIGIGLQRGIIGPALFSVLVLMAVATTLMTAPLFERLYGRTARTRGQLGQLNADGTGPPGVPGSR